MASACSPLAVHTYELDVKNMYELDVKNTFVHFKIPAEDSDRPASRRSQSEPASARAFFGKTCAGRRDIDWEHKPGKWTDSSTEVSTEAPLSEEESSVQSENSPRREVHGQQASCSEDVQRTERTRLSSQARAYRPSPLQAPCCPHVLIVPVMHVAYHAATFLGRLQAVATTMAALSGLGNDAYVQGGSEQSIRVVLRTRGQAEVEKLLTKAQECLAQVASQAGSLCILGGSLEWKASGFSAKLAEAPDPSQACWGMYSHGCCRRGEACTWQHPERSALLEVAAELKK